MKLYNVMTKKSYEKNGQEKTVWLTCGQLRVLDDGKKFLQLNMFPETSFYIFPQKKKEGEGLQGDGWDAQDNS